MVDVLPRDITTLPHVLGTDLIEYLATASLATASAGTWGRPDVWDPFKEAAHVIDAGLWYRTSFDATPGPVRHSLAAAGRIGLGDRRRLFTGVRDGRTDQAHVPAAIEPSLVAPRSAVRGGNAAACRNESVGRPVEQAEPARCRSGWPACRSPVHRFTLMSRQASGMCSPWCWAGLPPSGQLRSFWPQHSSLRGRSAAAAARSPEYPAPQAWSPPWPSYCDVTSSAASSGAESTAIGAALD